MTNQKNNFKFGQAKGQFTGASLILRALGYEIKELFAPENRDDYKELPLITIEFNEHILLPSMPAGFDLCYIRMKIAQFYCAKCLKQFN